MISATCSLRTSPSVIVTASIAVTPPSHDTSPASWRKSCTTHVAQILRDNPGATGRRRRPRRAGRPSARRRRAPQGPLWHPSRIEPCPRWIPLSQGDGGDRKRPLAAAERTPAGRHSSPDLTCRALSVIGRFNSLIVGFISLFGRFICLFGRVGNLHSGVSQYQ